MTEQEQKELDEFKLGIKNYLDLTDRLVDEIKKSCEAVMDKYDNVLAAIHALNDKVDLIAVDQGILERKVEEFN